jgi:hypothetical protein
VRFTFESARDAPTRVRLTENLPPWVTPNDVFGHGDRSDDEWHIGRRDLTYETPIEPGETRAFQYHIELQEEATPDDLLTGFRLEVGTDGSRVDDRSIDSGQTDSFGIPDYHLVPVAAGLFAALLGAVHPLEGQYFASMVLDGTVLTLDPLGVAVRFGAILSLVVLPYVPLGVAAHLAYRDERHRRRNAELTADERAFADQLRGTALASAVCFVGVCVAVMGAPSLVPAGANWVVAVLLAAVVAARKGSVMGTAEQLFGAVWVLGKILATAVVSGVVIPVFLLVAVPVTLVSDAVS